MERNVTSLRIYFMSMIQRFVRVRLVLVICILVLIENYVPDTHVLLKLLIRMIMLSLILI